MSIKEAMNQLRETLQQELGLVPTIDIRFHTGYINPILEFTPAALQAARILGEAVNEPVIPVSHEDYNWFNIGTNMTIFYHDLSYETYLALGMED